MKSNYPLQESTASSSQNAPLTSEAPGPQAFSAAPADVSDKFQVPSVAGGLGVGETRGARNVHEPFPALTVQSDEESIDWRGLFATIRRRRRIIALTFLSVVALGFLLTQLSNPVYESTASLEVVVPQQAGASADELPGLTSLLDNRRARSQATQVAVLQSAGVTDGAKKRVAAINPAWSESLKVLSELSVYPQPETDIIHVSARSHNSEAASAYAQEICREYITQSGLQSRQGVTNATSYINNRLKVVRKELDRARSNVRDFQKENGIVNLESEAEARSAGLIRAQDELRAFEAQRQADQAQLAALRASIARLSPTKTVPAGIQRSTVVEDMKKSLTAAELERVRLSQEYTAESEEIRSLDQQIIKIRQRMAREAQTQVTGWTIEKDPIHEQQTQAAAVLQSQIWANDSKIGAMQAAVQQQRSELAKVPAQKYRLDRLMTNMITLQETYKVLNDKALNLRLQKESSAVTGRLMPGVSSRKVSPRLGANLLTSLVLGLVLAAALAALIDRLDDRVHSRQEAESFSGLPVLAQIPYISDQAEQSLLATSGKSSMLLESYRMLRTNIEFSALGNSLRSLVITSTQPNEGKSTTSVDLGIAMALDGKKVILVDADLRRATLHELLNLPNRVGFTNVVAGTTTLDEALQATSVPGLFLLASGPAPPNPTELLNSRAARSVWAEIIDACDFALIDTPPALVMADAQIVASLVDAVVLVISMQEAGRREIGRTSALMMRTGTPVLGTVLTKTPPESSDYYYNKDRYYGSYADKSV